MVIAKRVSVILITILLLTVLLILFTTQEFSLVNWVNSLFVMSIILLILGSVLSLLQDGIFSRFIKNAKYVYRVVSFNKSKEVIDELEGRDSKRLLNSPSYQEKTKEGKLMTSIIIAGIIMVTLATILSYSISSSSIGGI